MCKNFVRKLDSMSIKLCFSASGPYPFVQHYLLLSQDRCTLVSPYGTFYFFDSTIML
jgi:hypothetical protein